MDAFLVAEMVVEATDARSGTVADLSAGGRVYSMLPAPGKAGLENLVFAGRTAPVGPCRSSVSSIPLTLPTNNL